MARAARFEELIAWQKARELNKAIYLVTANGAFRSDPDLRSQMRRAAVSVMLNVAEGFERLTPDDFRHFLRMARASCGEVRSTLYIAIDVGYMDDTTFRRLATQAEEVGRIIWGLRASIQSAKCKVRSA